MLSCRKFMVYEGLHFYVFKQQCRWVTSFVTIHTKWIFWVVLMDCSQQKTSRQSYKTFCFFTLIMYILFCGTNQKNVLQKETRGKPQAPSSSFLAFLIVSRSRYIIIQSSFTRFILKICRLTGFNTNCKWKLW